MHHSNRLACDVDDDHTGLDASHAANLKLILGGRTLKDDSQPLSQLRITPTTRLMVLHSAPAALHAAEARQGRLDQLRAAVKSMAMRNGNESNGELVLENQAGTSLHFPSEIDRKALTMGLMLHTKGTASMREVRLMCVHTSSW